ncbi:hypothetical protein EI94DRAFT_1744994 [Lactarius quietus]|nr:hypothetical protein EI94DRAFT_1744994 [Lactarius quietus]
MHSNGRKAARTAAGLGRVSPLQYKSNRGVLVGKMSFQLNEFRSVSDKFVHPSNVRRFPKTG